MFLKPLDISNLGTSKVLTLKAIEESVITELSSYVNVHSTQVASGLLRG
jgi:hypothetical protein